jgi:cyclopropane fatty-acyl-phospholipid synthase-like methyltransferase
MNGKNPLNRPDAYWERAGEVGYAEAMYTSADVEAHVRRRLWKIAIEIADTLGVPRTGHVLDLGCGDGAFANEVLAPHYRAVDGLDKSEAAIKRAQAVASGDHMRFRAVDLTTLHYDSLPRFDGAFLIGILHHVKAATPAIVASLGRVTSRIVVLEPNGNHLIRKLLEFTPSYRSAGEDSFRTREIMDIFENARFRAVVRKRLNLFPNFTPGMAYRLLRPLEPFVESSSFWNALCTVNLFGFERRT